MSHVYHGSDRGDLTRITPRRSTHGQTYIYATPHRLIALLFLRRWNDFLLTLGTRWAGGQLHMDLVERYKGAFEDIYGGKGGFIYTLEGGGFFHDPVCWELEVVSRQAAVPIACEPVPDVLARLTERAAAGEIHLWRYPHRPPAIPSDDGDMVQKALELYGLSGDLHNIRICMERFPHLQEALGAGLRREFDMELP